MKMFKKILKEVENINLILGVDMYDKTSGSKTFDNQDIFTSSNYCFRCNFEASLSFKEEKSTYENESYVYDEYEEIYNFEIKNIFNTNGFSILNYFSSEQLAILKSKITERIELE